MTDTKKSHQAPITSRNDVRGDQKPLFDKHFEITPDSLYDIADDPQALLELLSAKLALIPATYEVLETHLHDYDLPNEKPLRHRMPRAMTKTSQMAEKAISIVKMVPGEMKNVDSKADHEDSIADQLKATMTSERARRKAIKKVDDIALSCLSPLSAVVPKDLKPSEVNWTIKRHQTGTADDYPIPMKGLAKDGRTYWFLIAYIDLIIGWMVAAIVGSHPETSVLLDWGVMFRVSGVRPLPAAMFQNRLNGRIKNYYKFYTTAKLFNWRHDEPVDKMLHMNLYSDKPYGKDLTDLYKAYDDSRKESVDFHELQTLSHSSSCAVPAKTSMRLDAYVGIYDLMLSTLLFRKDAPKELLNNPIMQVVITETINLWSFYEPNGPMSPSHWFYKARDKMRSLTGDDNLNHGFNHLTQGYIEAWATFVYDVYDLMRRSDYDPDVLSKFVHGYDPETIRRILDSFKKSPIGTYSLKGKVIDLVRLYYVTVFAPAVVAPEISGKIAPDGVVTGDEFEEFLKFYVTINTSLGDGRWFMSKISDWYGSNPEDNSEWDLRGKYSSGLTTPVHLTMDDACPDVVVRSFRGMEWLDVGKMRAFLDFIASEDDDVLDSMPEDYIRESLQMMVTY